jgi:hypothetical protein
LTQVNAALPAAGHVLADFEGTPKMKTNEFYYLVFVCGAFAAFGIGLAVNYIRYRNWLKRSGDQH